MKVNIKLLLVDDDELLRQNLCDFLQDEGFSIAQAGDAELALQIAREFKPQAAVVDLRLPGMMGHSLIKELKKLIPNLVVVIYTGSADFDLSKDMLETGLQPENVLAKPLKDMAALAGLLKKQVKT